MQPEEILTEMSSDALQGAIFFDALTAQRHELAQRIDRLRRLNEPHLTAELIEEVHQVQQLIARLQRRFGAHWAARDETQLPRL